MKFQSIYLALGISVVVGTLAFAKDEPSDHPGGRDDGSSSTIGVPGPDAGECHKYGFASVFYTKNNSRGKVTLVEYCTAGSAEVNLATLKLLAAKKPVLALKAFFAHPELKLPRPRDGQIGMPNPSALYCKQLRGKSDIVESEAGSLAFCVFRDGSAMEEWTLYRGPESEDNAELVEKLINVSLPKPAEPSEPQPEDGSSFTGPEAASVYGALNVEARQDSHKPEMVKSVGKLVCKEYGASSAALFGCQVDFANIDAEAIYNALGVPEKDQMPPGWAGYGHYAKQVGFIKCDRQGAVVPNAKIRYSCEAVSQK